MLFQEQRNGPRRNERQKRPAATPPLGYLGHGAETRTEPNLGRGFLTGFLMRAGGCCLEKHARPKSISSIHGRDSDRDIKLHGGA